MDLSAANNETGDTGPVLPEKLVKKHDISDILG
jgi:hypothetical protein